MHYLCMYVVCTYVPLGVGLLAVQLVNQNHQPMKLTAMHAGI